MKKLTTALLLLFIAQFTIAQESKYFLNLDSGMAYYHKKKYVDAGRAFDKAFKNLNGKTTQSNFYNAACAWSLAGNKNKAFNYLQKIIDERMIRGWDDPVEFYGMLIKDSDFDNIKSDARWTTIIKEAERNKNIFLKGIKRELADGIKKLGTSDQAIRSKLDSVRKADGLNSKSEKDLIAVMRKSDSTNFAAFEEIIKQHGWLGPKEVGYKNNQYLFLILQHADLPSQKKYLPLFKKSYEAGKVLPKDLALIEDRINMREGKLQRYGSQTLIDKTSKKYILFPIADVDSIDQRRAMVGLESLKYYMKSSFNIDFDINKYKEELPQLKAKYLK
ncbi:DUF6624 domain-containing protein [uncultured Pedobacter sp.]|uniref:DUF6624 domain-containing protein n=1 Tax=uncultured Pedobacter sp. TaxID=246139 RepID=UPI0025EA93BA|nr:DUF6624 domain-containing protein [uncultured Pedobacter sp.]